MTVTKIDEIYVNLDEEKLLERLGVELHPYVRKMYIPTNDNMREDLLINVKSIHGEYISRIVEDHFGTKTYVAPIGNTGILLHECAAEDIPGLIIDNPYQEGITGSDFLLEELYQRPEWGFIRDGKFIDPRSVYPENIEKHRGYTFNQNGILVPEEEARDIYFDDNKLVISFLDQDSSPKLCILGAKDRTLERIKKQRAREGIPVLAVSEMRYENIANATLTNMGINYTLDTKTRKVESFINRPLDKPLPNGEKRDGKYDIGVEMGKTFDTAKANNLKAYNEIMETCPIYIICHRK